MLDWFRRKAAPETVTDDEEKPASSLTGTLRTEFVPGRSRYELQAQVQAATVQAGLPHAMDSAAMDDSYSVVAAISGFNISDSQFAFFGSQGFIGYQTMAMLAQNWLISKACNLPGEDAVRKGWQITADGTNELPPNALDLIRRLDKRMDIKGQLTEFAYFGRVFGIRHLIADVISDDPDYYEKPFNPDGITPGSYRGLTQIDPYWIAPVLTSANASNPQARHFYDPAYWTIQGRRIHRSHIIMFKGPAVADILKPTYRYGGVSVTQQIFERVYAAERTANEAPLLAQSKRETVLKTDIKAAMANQSEFDAMLQWWANKRDNSGVRPIGLDDEVEHLETSLADLDTTIMTQYQLVASIAGVPGVKLLGTQQKGFNPTGEYDESSYHESLETLQENKLTPVLDRHYTCLMRSEVIPKFKELKPHVSIVWNPLDSLTAKEQAEVNEINSRTGNNLVNSGAIDGMDERARITTDQKSGYHALPEIEAPDSEIDDNADPSTPSN